MGPQVHSKFQHNRPIFFFSGLAEPSVDSQAVTELQKDKFFCDTPQAARVTAH